MLSGKVPFCCNKRCNSYHKEYPLLFDSEGFAIQMFSVIEGYKCKKCKRINIPYQSSNNFDMSYMNSLDNIREQGIKYDQETFGITY